jgi:MFS family permease
VLNIIVQIVPLEKRATYYGFFGAIWGLASVLGPLVGRLKSVANQGAAGADTFLA